MEELTELQKQTLKVAQLSMDELPKTHLQLCQMIWAAYEAGEKVSQMQLPVMQKPKPKTLQAIFEIVDNIDFELAQLEDIAKGEIGDKITLLRKYIDENRVSA